MNNWLLFPLKSSENQNFSGSRSKLIRLSDSNEIRTHNHLVRKRTQPFTQTGLNDWAVLWVLVCTVHLTVCYYVTSFRVNLHSIDCVNVKELLPRSRRRIWSLSEMAKWLNVRLQTKWLGVRISLLVFIYILTVFELCFSIFILFD